MKSGKQIFYALFSGSFGQEKGRQSFFFSNFYIFLLVHEHFQMQSWLIEKKYSILKNECGGVNEISH